MGSLLIAWLCMLCLFFTFRDKVSRKILYPVALVVVIGTLGCWTILM
ncbi:hypothetical protein M2105_004603 [Paenibacillus sp. PastF-1]|nr:hypothetical protein [Paenibacillus sp. PastF-2]MDF9850021.1 hypothetical protein [Paenibacillus sp. PastM-2]MDF9856729.1 hypothetical protein [Paenibacillus sp. PastF-1]MDH6482000.1 hypothetical protein [Paenibacillus sp. PastH-2]MDH6509424.1 hypothetical protein [Paenibacillus sp. PastM-3]